MLARREAPLAYPLFSLSAQFSPLPLLFSLSHRHSMASLAEKVGNSMPSLAQMNYMAAVKNYKVQPRLGECLAGWAGGGVPRHRPTFACMAATGLAPPLFL